MTFRHADVCLQAISITWEVSYYNTIFFGITEGVTPSTESTVYWIVT